MDDYSLDAKRGPNVQNWQLVVQNQKKNQNTQKMR